MIEIDVGKRFGNLTALERDVQKGRYWKCKCDCGNIKSIYVYDVVGGKTKSCGCTTFKQRFKTRINKLISIMVGKKFSKLTVLNFSCIRNGKSYWKCKCDCDNEVIVSMNNLKSGAIKSCGCLRTNKYKSGEAGLRKIYLNYKKSAKKEGHKFELTLKEFKDITSKVCAYCGIEPLTVSATERSKKIKIIKYTLYKYNGIDRIDSSKGYEKGNINPCCQWCNFIKRERSVEELKEHVNRIYIYLK
jgi:hypothetical protein